ncbi:class I SAM-dependent methyltransferase [Falsiroseomonas tokyonensis]|uniref:Class I SAM-dependent methyltransferase n=1 Tax=Falsiroseomonas tokyonensis TaxID=430521 RepID=A0ABV7BRV9_9PROT|nr:class I SAM-dependent methyltransferase [Falsiroseomonas tokyonensis]MBU8538364.1 class I SAM-dependent methyltransferase [Falsiroseomonas tokyonensis]
MTRHGTEGYAAEAEALLRQSESIRFEDLHAGFLDLIPPAPARVLDIGAGTGRDAAALAEMGHQVLAVEPTAELRAGGAALHPSPRLAWQDDGLPELARVVALGQCYDLVLLTAVWMHLAAADRGQAMPVLAGLLAPGGRLWLSLRHGPVPQGRVMHAVDPAEVIAQAAAAGLTLLRRRETGDTLGRDGVHWTRLAFARAL